MLVWLLLSSSPCLLVHFRHGSLTCFLSGLSVVQATAFMPIAPSTLLVTRNQRTTSMRPLQCSYISDLHTDRVTRAAFMKSFVGVSVLIAPGQSLAADDNKASDPTWAAHDGPFDDSEFAGYAMSPSGLKYKDVVAGSGAQPEEDPLKSPTEHLFPNTL
jgi:hypothetical protein